MKKIGIFILGIATAFSLCACACSNNAPTTEPTGSSTTAPTTAVTVPTVTLPGTNIPDPTVNSNSTMPTDGIAPGTSQSTGPNSRILK